MNLRKTFFILPNLFTLSSVFCGFFAITLCTGGGSSSLDALYQAAVAICFAYFFDLADGRVARLTKTQSDLGMQLDSLADVISFGVAPALLVYRWGLTSFGKWGIFIAFLFCAAGALRLARFNVLAMQHDSAKPGKFIIGLPVPAASAVLVSLVLLNHQLAGSYVDVGQPALAHPRRRALVLDGEPHPLPLVQGPAPVAAHHHRLSRHRRLHRRGAHRPHALGAHLRRPHGAPTSASA